VNTFYISFGAGWQSTALCVMSALEWYGCPRANVAVFADTGEEPQWVYDTVDMMREWLAQFKIHVVTVKEKRGRLGQVYIERIKGLRRSASPIPLFVKKPNDKVAMLMRGCTRDFKIRPIQKYIRETYGKKDGVTALLGISTDEAHRMKPSNVPWIVNQYPLIDAGVDRAFCKEIVEAAGLIMPKKSACVFCPYHSDRYWAELKQLHPEEFERAAAFDDQIRHAPGAQGPTYLHRSCRPLREIKEFGTSEIEGFGNECAGICGV
jgi:hypothetical protein